MNDTAETLEFELEYGYISFKGEKQDTAITKVTVKPFTKAVLLAQCKKGSHNTLEGLFYAKSKEENDGMIPAIFGTSDFRKRIVPAPDVKITSISEVEGKVSFIVTSDRYAHGVHFEFKDNVLLSDEYFDLLPGESREIKVLNGIEKKDIENSSPCFVPMNT